MNMHRYFSIWSFLIMLILTLFLVMLSAKRNQKGNDKVMLRPLSVEDVFENGSLFEDISEPLISRLENRMAIIAVPNFREIEVADQSIKTGIESDECVILLQAFPEYNIYIWGYCDAEVSGYGLIFDIGEKQNIFRFPYRYMSNNQIPPEFTLSYDKKCIFCICHTGHGSGISVSELILFQIDKQRVKPYILELNELCDQLNESIQLIYNVDENTVSVSDDESYSICAVGVEPNTQLQPTDFFCGNNLSFYILEDQLYVYFVPTLYAGEESSATIQLMDFSGFITPIYFDYGADGTVRGFEVGPAEKAS